MLSMIWGLIMTKITPQNAKQLGFELHGKLDAKLPIRQDDNESLTLWVDFYNNNESNPSVFLELIEYGVNKPEHQQIDLPVSSFESLEFLVKGLTNESD